MISLALVDSIISLKILLAIIGCEGDPRIEEASELPLFGQWITMLRLFLDRCRLMEMLSYLSVSMISLPMEV